jgi:hypothetical protein
VFARWGRRHWQCSADSPADERGGNGATAELGRVCLGGHGQASGRGGGVRCMERECVPASMKTRRDALLVRQGKRLLVQWPPSLRLTGGVD